MSGGIQARLEAAREEVARIEGRLVELRDADEITDDEQAEIDRLLGAGDEPGDLTVARARVTELEGAVERMARFEPTPEQKATRVDTVEERADGQPERFNVNTKSRADIWDLDQVRSMSPSELKADIRGRSLEAIERSEHFLNDDHREESTRKVERGGEQVARLIHGGTNPLYRSAYYKAMSDKQLTPEEQGAFDYANADKRSFFDPVDGAEAHRIESKRAMTVSNVTGVLVPSQLDTTIILTNDGALNPFRQISRVETISTNVWTGVSSAGVTAGWTGAEGSQVGDDAPSFASPSVTAYMADAFIPLSFQAFDDWTDREDELARLFADAKFRLEATAHATGSGTNQPTGIVTALDANTNVEVGMTTAGAFGLVDVYLAEEALGDRYKDNATWVMHNNYWNEIRQFGTSNNYHGFTVDLTEPRIPQMLGYAGRKSSAMHSAALTTSSVEDVIVFGDFRDYLIADRLGARTEIVQNLFHTDNNRPSGQRGVLFWWRTGADSINDSAFVLLQNQT